MTPSPRDQRLRPRKAPQQPRAHETRARILDAARTVFGTHGYSAGTTNRIAAEAGLSIGSLYQYFPNKDAILVELVDAHIDEGTNRVAGALTSAVAAHAPELPPLVELVDVVVGAMVAVHATERRLHRVLFEEAPRPRELLDRLATLEATLVELLAGLLDRHTEVGTRTDTRVTARMVVTTVESLVHRIVTNEASGIDDERFRVELVRLVVGYLTDSTDPGPTDP